MFFFRNLIIICSPSLYTPLFSERVYWTPSKVRVTTGLVDGGVGVGGEGGDGWVGGQGGQSGGGCGVSSDTGINNTCPTNIKSGLVKLFASTIAATVVPYLAAIWDRVSPARTIYLIKVVSLLYHVFGHYFDYE